MGQIFHPSSNTIAKASILGGVFIVGAIAMAVYGLNLSPYNTQVNVARDQPVPFSHEHHVAGLGIDCRYCHTSVEESNFAGMPSTKTCMTCHSQVWTNAAMIEPIRNSWRTNTPVKWTRVHNLPDYVQFNHSVHVNKGVGCYSCHGEVDKMPLMWKAHTLQMQWCLECHRDPAPNLRPPEQIFTMRPTVIPEGKSATEFGQELLQRYHVRIAPPHAEGTEKTPNPLTNCSTCHY